MDGRVRVSLVLDDLRDLGPAVERTRRLLDADCDPEAVDELLGADPLLAPLVRQHPGLRVPGHVDGDELAVRAVLGQQVSVARARTMAADLAASHGEPLDDGGRLFPSAGALAELEPADLPMPGLRARALVTLCRALSQGDLRLDRGADREEVREGLLDVPGIGPWTAGYVAQRALGDPDVFLAGDVGVRAGLDALGVDPGRATAVTERWRPWRSYAQMHLWTLAASSSRAVPRTPGARRERM
jgi:AraC family transcriptional regulator of adaptative response / DNA-3-methyladenine glycosylase II